jgi:hypothetical protein
VLPGGGRNIPGSTEISLLGSHELLARLQVFRQHATAPGAVAFDHGGVSGEVSRRSTLMISATSVMGFPRIVHPKIVQRYRVSGFFQPAASSDHQIIGGNGFQNFEYGLFR